MSIIALIRSDTTDGDTTLVDSYGNTISQGSSIKHSTDQSKWGTSSIEYVDEYDWFSVTIANALTSDDITVDFWYWFPVGGLGGDIAFGPFNFKQNGTDLELWESTAAHSIKVTAATYITEGAWNHIGISLGSSGVTMARLYINGVLAGDDTGNNWAALGIIGDINTVWYFGRNGQAKPVGYIDEAAIHEDELIDFAATGVPTGAYPEPPISELDGLVDFELSGVINAERDIYEFNTGGLVDFELAGSMSATSYSQVVLSGNPITFVVDGGFTLGKNQISGLIDFVVAGEINVQTEDATDIAGHIDFALGGNINAESSSYLQLSGSRIDFAVDGYIGIEVDKEMSVVGLVDFAINGDFSIVNPPEFSLSSSIDFDINGTINAKGSDTCVVSSMPYARSLKC